MLEIELVQETERESACVVVGVVVGVLCVQACRRGRGRVYVSVCV